MPVLRIESIPKIHSGRGISRESIAVAFGMVIRTYGAISITQPARICTPPQKKWVAANSGCEFDGDSLMSMSLRKADAGEALSRSQS
jgi:hypothetical protein